MLKKLGKMVRRRRAAPKAPKPDPRPEQDGIMAGDERSMGSLLRSFRETVAREVMVPRTEISAVEVGDGVAGAVEEIIATGHSRVPVYEGSVDGIVGIAYAKDLLRCLKEGKAGGDLRTWMREAYFIPETKRLHDLFAEFKSRRLHIAVVIDEYGGTSGLITLEDLLEEIVGEIEDEFDLRERLYVEAGPDAILASARLEIDRAAQALDSPVPDGEFTTVGGWIIERIGRIPKAGEEFEIDGLAVLIEQAEERKIRKARIRRRHSPSGGAPAGPD